MSREGFCPVRRVQLGRRVSSLPENRLNETDLGGIGHLREDFRYRRIGEHVAELGESQGLFEGGRVEVERRVVTKNLRVQFRRRLFDDLGKSLGPLRKSPLGVLAGPLFPLVRACGVCLNLVQLGEKVGSRLVELVDGIRELGSYYGGRETEGGRYGCRSL